MRQPVKCPRTGLWLARYTAPDGSVLQVGRFERKRDAQQAIATAMGRGTLTAPPLIDFFEDWLARFPRHPRTQQTNEERIRRYILPYLPHKGHFPLTELRRSSLRQVQAQLLLNGLSKETIDGAFSSLSAMMRDAIDDELLEANPAHGIRVRPNDPRLNPKRLQRKRRAVPADEVGTFMDAVPAVHRAVCWTPFLSGVRPGELFGLTRADLDRGGLLVFVHQTVSRYGHLEPGLKTTHHVRDRERRGRWGRSSLEVSSRLLMPVPPISTAGSIHRRGDVTGRIGTSIATCGNRRRKPPAPISRYTTRATRSRRVSSQQESRSSRSPRGWGTPCALEASR